MSNPYPGMASSPPPNSQSPTRLGHPTSMDTSGNKAQKLLGIEEVEKHHAANLATKRGEGGTADDNLYNFNNPATNNERAPPQTLDFRPRDTAEYKSKSTNSISALHTVGTPRSLRQSPYVSKGKFATASSRTKLLARTRRQTEFKLRNAQVSGLLGLGGNGQIGDQANIVAKEIGSNIDGTIGAVGGIARGALGTALGIVNTVIEGTATAAASAGRGR